MEQPASRWIQDLRRRIKEALRSEGNIDSGDKDVILSGGPGYRFAKCVSVRFVTSPAITDITDTRDGSDVPMSVMSMSVMSMMNLQCAVRGSFINCRPALS